MENEITYVLQCGILNQCVYPIKDGSEFICRETCKLNKGKGCRVQAVPTDKNYVYSLISCIPIR